MKFHRSRKAVGAVLAAAVLVGGGTIAIAPAVADDGSSFAAMSWKKVWKKKLIKYADQRYYTKTQSDAKFSTKTETSALLGNHYTKAQSDATIGNYYTKAQSDAKYAPAQKLYRGSVMLSGNVPAGDVVSHGISFGATFSAPPTPHYIAVGAPIPAGCLGTAAAPDAAPGHLCIFETEGYGPIGTRSTCRAGGNLCGVADAYGAGVYAISSAAGYIEILASWAARPLALANPSMTASTPKINQGAAGPSPASGR